MPIGESSQGLVAIDDTRDVVGRDDRVEPFRVTVRPGTRGLAKGSRHRTQLVGELGMPERRQSFLRGGHRVGDRTHDRPDVDARNQRPGDPACRTRFPIRNDAEFSDLVVAGGRTHDEPDVPPGQRAHPGEDIEAGVAGAGVVVERKGLEEFDTRPSRSSHIHLVNLDGLQTTRYQVRMEKAMNGWQSPEQLAEYLDLPLATIYQWRHRRTGPVGYRIGRHVRYRSDDVERWLAEQRDDRG